MTTRRGFRRVAADLDRIASRESPVEDVVGARLDLEALAPASMTGPAPILIMHHEGRSMKEIADILGLDRKTVARKMRQIAEIYRKPMAQP